MDRQKELQQRCSECIKWNTNDVHNLRPIQNAGSIQPEASISRTIWEMSMALFDHFLDHDEVSIARLSCGNTFHISVYLKGQYLYRKFFLENGMTTL